MPVKKVFTIVFCMCTLTRGVSFAQDAPEKRAAEKPIVIDGETVEYSTDNKEVSVTGKAKVDFKGTRLTCDTLTVNTETKDAHAFGNVRLEEAQGIIEGEDITYNFQDKTGTIIDAQFRSNPYFGKSERIQKVSENEFVSWRGHMTTCSMDQPHYRIKSRKVDFFPGDRVDMRDGFFYLGSAPLFYLPQLKRSLKEPLMHVQVTPGKRKQGWGKYLLTAWRYRLNDNATGRIYADWREKLGLAEGFGLNYDTKQFGKGDYKFYYTHEVDKSIEKNSGIPRESERYLIRWRHRWDIDEKTDMTAEYYKIKDSKIAQNAAATPFLKEYFYREYEKDTQPLSYALFHHYFDHGGSLNLYLQKRTNRWYGGTEGIEKLPEIRYDLPSVPIGDSPFYFDNNSSYVNYNQKAAVPSPSSEDVTYNQFDITNKISMPSRLSIFQVNPFVSAQQITNDKSTYGSTLNAVFSTGSDLTTKFYRVFNVASNFLGLNINGLRHIITPTINYSYTHRNIMPSSKARIGGGAHTSGSTALLELSNKLQTRRDNKRVELADFRVNSSYLIKPKTGAKTGSNLSDVLFDLELYPYSWLSIGADALYSRAGNRYTDENYNHFSQANLDVGFKFDEERRFGIGQRYQRKGGKEMTFDAEWRLTPKWKFKVYERYQFVDHLTANIKKGLREQEYMISRDLHCWTVELVYNVAKDKGESVWLLFRLNAFPELEFDFNQSYHSPKPGSQSRQ